MGNCCFKKRRITKYHIAHKDSMQKIRTDHDGNLITKRICGNNELSLNYTLNKKTSKILGESSSCKVYLANLKLLKYEVAVKFI